MTDPYGGGRHRGAALDEDDAPTAAFWVDPDPWTEDETPTARFVLNSYRGVFDHPDDDAPTMRFVLNPYREAYEPFGDRPPAVIEGEVVWRGEVPSRPPAREYRATGYGTPEYWDDDPDDEQAVDEPADDEQADDEPAESADEIPADDVETDDERFPDVPADEPAEPVEPRWEDLGPHTVGGATELIVQELAPAEMTRFPIVVQRFFEDEVLRRRVIRWALSGARRDDPLALQLGGPKSELVTVLSLAMLTCAATGVLGHVGTRHHGGVARWRRNRGAARRRLIHGPATALPHLSSLGTATVGQIVEEAAEDAGFTPDRARRLSILILSALTRPLH
ncbi:hypothetical protein [Cryptosporangium arvum]|uniref:hypothetical protein n=1 Tax=Cryptosporangium arvum TaxID=80871 RepID=UPI0004BB7246|nr:hypothetical protein [Cryptosporangium arvum]